MLKINGVTVKTPSSLVVSIRNVGSRVDINAAGNSVMDRTGRKRRLDLRWRYLTNTEMSAIVNNAADAFFSVTYYDPEGMSSKTLTCYVEHFEFGMQRYSGAAAVGWEDARLELMER